jgi:hypothetical protein
MVVGPMNDAPAAGAVIETTGGWLVAKAAAPENTNPKRNRVARRDTLKMTSVGRICVNARHCK